MIKPSDPVGPGNAGSGSYEMNTTMTNSNHGSSELTVGTDLNMNIITMSNMSMLDIASEFDIDEDSEVAKELARKYEITRNSINMSIMHIAPSSLPALNRKTIPAHTCVKTEIRAKVLANRTMNVVATLHIRDSKLRLSGTELAQLLSNVKNLNTTATTPYFVTALYATKLEGDFLDSVHITPLETSC
jgi:hypothetical protein